MSLKREIALFTILFSVFLHAYAQGSDTMVSDSTQKVSPVKTGFDRVYSFPIKGPIDARMDRQVTQALDEATKVNADLVIIDMDTYGGGVLEADSIRRRILLYSAPVWVYINGNAGSAGSLISIACDSIFMAPGSSFGASTVVNQEGEVVPEKYQAFMRSKMRATAEAQGRDPKIAESMVGLNLQTDSATVTSFTPKEAIENNYCEGEYASLSTLLDAYALTDSLVAKYEAKPVDNVISFFLNPALKSILILVILGGLYFELQSPGVGFPLIAAGVALVLYFVPDYLEGLLSNWEIIVFLIGLTLIVVEIFVIPGFGVIGIAGIILVLCALMLSMLDNDYLDFSRVSDEAVRGAIIVMCVSVAGSVFMVFFGSQAIVKSKAFKKIALGDAVTGHAVETEQQDELIGMIGECFTVLRPGGRIKINGEVYEASTRGDFVDKGEKVIVVANKNMVLRVKKYQEA